MKKKEVSVFFKANRLFPPDASFLLAAALTPAVCAQTFYKTDKKMARSNLQLEFRG